MNFKTFCLNNHHVLYEEMPSRDPLFEKFYLIENPMRDPIVAIPDGCIDLQFTWENNTCYGYAVGSFLTGKLTQTGTYQRCFGMKLRPGVIFNFMRHNVFDVIESRIPLSRYLDIRSLELSLEEKQELPEMVSEAQYYFDRQIITPIHNIASHTAEMICSMPGGCRVSDMIQTLGYSHRYVDNVFKGYFGVSVKKYSDIIRIQTAIDYLETMDVMDVIAGLGYYDQAHFIHDFKKYTSLTPQSFVKQNRRSQLDQTLVIV